MRVSEGLEADAVAEGFEVADRACFGLREDTAGEVVGAGITLELGVGEHLPVRDEYGVLHGDKCFHRTTAGGDTPGLG